MEKPHKNTSPMQKEANRDARLRLKARTQDGKPLSREQLAALVQEEYKRRTLASGAAALHRLQYAMDIEASKNISFADALAAGQEAEEGTLSALSEPPIAKPEYDGGRNR